MDILDQNEAQNLHPLGKGKYSELHKKLIQLEIGQAVVVRQEEWTIKTTPYRIIRNVEKLYARKFEYGRHPDGNGWLAKRVA